MLGSAATGRGGEAISVNAATGNLIISRRDEFLAGRSLDIGISRTYNSRAEVHDGDNGDYWQMSTARRVFDLSSDGNSIKRLSADGSVVTYEKQGDGTYLTTDGAGAHDIMWLSGGDWYWRDGDSRVEERYDADPNNAGSFRLFRQADKDGQYLAYSYDASGRLDTVKTNNGEYVRYKWSDVAGKTDQLLSIETEFDDPRTGQRQFQTGTYYTYDGQGRLATVTFDLSPEASGTGDGYSYTTSFLYGGDSNRITSIIQSDGSQTDFAYDGAGRVWKLTEYVDDLPNRITKFAYYADYTEVTAPNGQVTRIGFDAATKMMREITAPPVYAGAQAQVQSFVYDGSENLLSSTAPDGHVTYYTYDTRGNVTKIDRPIGTDVGKLYDENDNLIREKIDVSNEANEQTTVYTRYAYDDNNHLRYKVSPQGRVTEYRYDSYGRLVWEGSYSGEGYPVGSALIDVTGMNAWRDGLSDKTQAQWSRHYYDARGNLSRTDNFGGTDATGTAKTDADLGGYSRSWYVYDQAGRLLTRYQQGQNGKEQFAYDGMGRLVSSSDSSGAATHVFFDDANTRTVIQMSSGLTRTMTYNNAGDLISETESALGGQSAPIVPDLAAWGKQSRVTRTQVADIAGKPAYRFSMDSDGTSFINTGFTVAAGETVTYRITVMGDGTTTTQGLGIRGNVDNWGSQTTDLSKAIIIDGPGRLKSAGSNAYWQLEGLSTTSATTVEITRTFSTAQWVDTRVQIGGTWETTAGSSVILSDPVVTRTFVDPDLAINATTLNQYDKMGRLRITQGDFDGRGPSYIIYDKAGRKTGVIDPSGALAEYFYDAANRLIGTTTYYNKVSNEVLNILAGNPDHDLEMAAVGTNPGIRPGFNNTYDVRSFTTYDENGRVAQTFNGEGEVVSFEYDAAGRIIETRSHANRLTINNSWRTAPPAEPVEFPEGTDHSNDAVTRTFYDRDGNVRGVLDGEGYLSEIVYDKAGRKVEEIAYGKISNSDHWVSGTFNQLRSTVSPNSAALKRTSRYVYDGRGNLRYQIDNAGYVTAFKYNAADQLTRTINHINPLASTHTDWTFDGLESAVAGSSADRNVYNYYDSSGRLYRTYDSVALNNYFYYDDAGNVVKTTSGNRTTRTWYDARGNLRFSLDAEGYLSSFLYNAAGQVTNERRHGAVVDGVTDNTSIQDMVGEANQNACFETRFTYDSQGRVIYSYDGEGNRTRFSYRNDGQLSLAERSHQDQNDISRTDFYYDKAGRVVRQQIAGGQPEESNTKFTYDAFGNQIKVEDGNGHFTTFTYDDRGNVLSETNAEGDTVEYEYNAFGQVVKTWDARAVAKHGANVRNTTATTEHVYNNRGLVESTFDALGSETSYIYTHFGEVQKVTDARGAQTSFFYDLLGRVTSTVDAKGSTEAYTYDAFGNRLTVTNKLGGVTSYVYDDLGRVTSTTNANNFKTSYSYDSRGNVSQMKQALVAGSSPNSWHTTDYTYDANGRLLTSTVDMFTGRATESLTYDGRGNVTSKTAPDGGRTIYFYDDLDRVKFEVNAEGTATRYSYDGVGNVVQIRVYSKLVDVPADGGSWAEGNAAGIPPSGNYRQTEFDYDDANRMVESRVVGVDAYKYNGSSLVERTDVPLVTKYEYDANGNVVKTIDPNGRTTWAFYDKMNRKEHQVDALNYRTTWTYDAVGNVISERAFATAVATPTNTDNVPAATWESAVDRRTDYTYDLMGNRLSEQRFSVKTYDGNGGEEDKSPIVRYEYNGLGLVTKKTEAIAGNVTDYTYDDGGRLTREERAAFTDYSGATVRPTVDYEYDGLGNLTKTTAIGNATAAARITTYAYTGGKLASMTDAAGGTFYYGYDAAGRENESWYTRKNHYNVSTTQGVTRSYDLLGRVVSEYQGTRASGGVWTKVSPETKTTYTAYGEVATIQFDGGAKQINTYDDAGRLVKTNSGDGVYKLFGYDLNGNQVAAITSAGAQLSGHTFASALDLVDTSDLTDINFTYTRYDKRNQAIFVDETHRAISGSQLDQKLTTAREYNAFGEVSKEIAANGAEIDYTYNTMGRVISVQNPEVEYQQENANGTLAAKVSARSTEHYYYDLGGRLVAQRDANGNLTRFGMLNGTGFGGSQGLVTTETYADGGVKTTKYDIHGDARRIIGVADGRTSTQRTIEQTFDTMGRVTQVWNRGSGLQDNYTYDIAGQQLSHWNNLYTSSNREVLDYDAMGRVISSRAFGGNLTTTTYVWEASSNTNAVGNFGGWKETTKLAGVSIDKIEWTDAFDRQVKKRDHGNHTYTFGYDLAGRLASMSGSGANQVYEYYNSGKLKSISNVTGSTGTNNYQELKTTYGYDEAGNLTSQKTTDAGSSYYQFYWNDFEPDFYEYSWSRTTQNMTATYDKLGRMTTWNEAGGGDLPAASMEWTYDANGNIRRSKATYRSIFSDQTVATGNSTQDNWYRYDSMNRVVTSRGVLANNNTIVRGTQGRDILYNAAGQRTQVLSTQRASQRVFIRTYDGDYNINSTSPTGNGAKGGKIKNSDLSADIAAGGSQGYYETVYYDQELREEYIYNAAGQLSQAKSAAGWFDGGGYAELKSINGNVNSDNFVYGAPENATKRATFAYDLLGRTTSQYDYQSDGTTVAFSKVTTFNTDGTVYGETSITKKGSDTYKSVSYNSYNTDNSLRYSTTTNYKNNNSSDAPNTRTDNTYVWYDGAVQQQVTYDSDTGTSSNTIYKSTYSYDALGVLQSAQINDGRPRSVSFINNAEGQVISRKERDNKYDQGDPSEIYYRFGGKEIGRVGNNGTSNVAYEKSISERQMDTSNNYGAFRNGASSGSSFADFGGDYDAINSFSQAGNGGTYTVRGGETLQAIAAQLWGDPAMWYKLAEANGLTGSEPLIEGRSLVIPAGVQRVHHNSGTMKPYDPAEAIGDTSPTAAKQPKKKKCGVFGAILMSVIAIAVTVIAPFGGGFVASIANSMLGSIVSQAFGVATGIQDKFSFKSVAMAGIGATVGGGIGEIFGQGAVAGSQVAGDVLRGALSSAVTQGIGVATGLQENFSWAGVAAAGVAAGIGGAVTRGLSKNKGFFGDGKTALTNGQGQTLVGADGNPIIPGNGSWQWNVNDAGTGFVQPGFGATAASSAVRMIASAATRSAIEGSSFGRNVIAGLPDVIGQVVGGVGGAAIKRALTVRPRIEYEPVDLDDSVTGGAPPAQAPIIVDQAQASAARTEGEGLRQVIVGLKGGDREKVEAYLDRIGPDAPPEQGGALRQKKIIVGNEVMGENLTTGSTPLVRGFIKDVYLHGISRDDIVDYYTTNLLNADRSDSGRPFLYDDQGLADALIQDTNGDPFARGLLISGLNWTEDPGLQRLAARIDVVYQQDQARADAAALEVMRIVLPPLDTALSVNAIAQGDATTGDYVTVGTSAAGPLISKAGTLFGIAGAVGSRGSKLTGTVWDLIKATDDAWAGTVVPRSFELAAGNAKYWVHPNATEHMAERAVSMLNRGNSQAATDIATQAQLTSFQAAVATVTQEGSVAYRQMIRQDGWELMFSAPRQPDQLPVIYHALYRGD